MLYVVKDLNEVKFDDFHFIPYARDRRRTNDVIITAVGRSLPIMSKPSLPPMNPHQPRGECILGATFYEKYPWIFIKPIAVTPPIKRWGLGYPVRPTP